MSYGMSRRIEQFWRLEWFACSNTLPGLVVIAAIIAALLFSTVAGGQTPRTEDELVHYGDIIDVDVLGGFEFDWRGTLNPEGFLDGANGYGDQIYGLCRSESEIADDLTKAFSKFLREPKVIVRLIDRSNRAVAMLDGAVRSPQRFQLRRPATLRELIVLSGGLTDEASGTISIFRPGNLNCLERNRDRTNEPASEAGQKGNGTQLIDITIAELLKGNKDADPLVKSGDLITVQRAVPIYLIGGVNSPRQISARSSMSLSRAIASAGGLSKDADPAHVTVFRRSGGETKSIEVDLEKIEAGSAADPELKALDIVDVGQKGRTKRKFPPVVSAGRTDRIGSLPLRIVE